MSDLRWCWAPGGEVSPQDLCSGGKTSYSGKSCENMKGVWLRDAGWPPPWSGKTFWRGLVGAEQVWALPAG